MIFEDFPERHVEGLNGVSGVDGFTNFSRKGKERSDALPAVDPGLANRRILLVPFLGKVH